MQAYRSQAKHLRGRGQQQESLQHVLHDDSGQQQDDKKQILQAAGLQGLQQHETKQQRLQGVGQMQAYLLQA